MLWATVGALRELAASRRDASGYFPAMYARVTAEIARTVDRAGFADGRSMEAFADDFARRYTDASARTIERPACWQACWDVAGDGKLLIVQHLLLGVNAHVNYDLPQAVVRAARAAGGLDLVRADFDAVNAVLAATSVDVIRDLDRVSRWVSELASIGGGRLFNFSLRVARDQAWAAAERMYPLDDDGTREYLAELDRLVSVLAYLIVHPGLPARLAIRVARLLEEHDPIRVTATLLGDPPGATR
jgi:hypothetical protein